MSQIVYFTRHTGGLSIFIDGVHKTVASDHPNFNKILARLRAKQYGEIINLIDGATAALVAATASIKLNGCSVAVKHGTVRYTNAAGVSREMDGPLVDRIIENASRPNFRRYAVALMNFMDNVMKNPVKDIREELYQFLQAGLAPFTPDGCFLAYKNVRHDFKDIHSGTLDNSPGRVVRMRPEDVDKDRNQTCSDGLHFAARGYLNSYSRHGNGHTIIVKVNPMHVFAIPTDYQFQKGRCCEYFVVGELDGREGSEAFNDSFIDEDTKSTVAPKVRFIDTGLRPSLLAKAKSYNMVDDNGRVDVAIQKDGTKIPVRVLAEGNFAFVDILGKKVTGDVVQQSFETKSVRSALKAEVDRAEKAFLEM